MKRWTQQEAMSWFRSTVEENGMLEPSASTAAFADAWLHAEGLEPERWRGWVRQCVQRAKSIARDDPGGELPALFRSGPQSPPSKPSVSAHDVFAERGRAEVERQQREAAGLPYAGRDTVPPMMHALRAVSEGRDPDEVWAAWAAADYPAPCDFPYPFE